MQRGSVVLSRLERGEIGVEDACRQLERGPLPRRGRSRKAHWLRVQIRESGDDGTNINFRVPTAIIGFFLGVVGLAVRFIPTDRWDRWLGNNGAVRDDGEPGSADGKDQIKLGKREIVLVLQALRQARLAGAGVDIEDGDDRVRICLE